MVRDYAVRQFGLTPREEDSRTTFDSGVDSVFVSYVVEIFCELRGDGVLRSSHLALVDGIMLSGLPALSCLERGGRYLCPATSKTRQGSSRLRP